MTDTTIVVEPQQNELSEHDFKHKPRCEAFVTLGGYRFRIPLWFCRKRAKWAAILPCCGRASYSCNKHRFPGFIPNYCGRCRNVFPHSAMKWVAL